jgi:hypothetical protein
MMRLLLGISFSRRLPWKRSTEVADVSVSFCISEIIVRFDFRSVGKLSPVAKSDNEERSSEESMS